MAVLPEMVPVSDLRQDTTATLNRLEHSRDPIVITQRGRAAAVLMSVDAYEHREEERLLLRRLANGDQEIQSGQGYALEDVLGEAEALLHSESA